MLPFNYKRTPRHLRGTGYRPNDASGQMSPDESNGSAGYQSPRSPMDDAYSTPVQPLRDAGLDATKGGALGNLQSVVKAALGGDGGATQPMEDARPASVLPFTVDRKRRVSAPMDERLPDGRTVDEAISAAGAQSNPLQEMAAQVAATYTRQPASGAASQTSPTVKDGGTMLDTSAPPMAEPARRAAESMDYDPARAETRARVSDPLEFEEDRNLDLRSAQPNETPEWWKRLAGVALEGFAQGGRGGDAASGAGGALAGGLLGLFDRRSLGRLQQRRDVAESDTRLKSLREREAVQLGRRDKLSQIELREAQRDYTRDIKPQEARLKAARQEQTAVLGILTKLKDIRLDPSNPAHQSVIERANNVGFPLSAESWNRAIDDRRNPFTMEITDPNEPTVKTRVRLNRETGQFERVTLDGAPVGTGFQQPVGADGLTEQQRRGDEDRDRAFEQRVGEFRERMTATLPARAKQRFDVEVAGAFKELSDAERDLSTWQKRKAEGLYREEVADRYIAEAEARRNELRARIDESRQRTLREMGGASVSTSPGTSPGAVKGRVGRSTFGQFRKQNPAHASKTDVEIEALLRAAGYEVY